ncbi:MAG: response regulator [Bacteroidota bacterium]|jgi:DNA-binding LytR/AlgR family response regulator
MMNEIKIIIVEDEVITATDLKETLEKSGHKVIALARSHAEAITAIEKQTPELMIIDIRLKHSSFDGIEIAAEIGKIYSIPFVFLTANAELKTFQRAKLTNPAAYLLKPFRHKELVFQVELAYNHFMANKKDENNPILSDNIFLPIEKGHQKIVKSEVLFLKAEGAYVNVFVKDLKAPYLFSMNLGYLSQYFNSSNFYQISRSYIINLDYLNTFDSESVTLNFHEGKIPIPHNKKGELIKRLAVIKTP